MTAPSMMAQRPRILVLTSTFPRWAGDIEPGFVLHLCRELQRYCELQVLAPHFPGAALSEVLEGVPVRRFRYWIPRWQSLAFEGGIVNRIRQNPLRLFMLPAFVMAQLLAARRLLRSGEYDTVHAHWIIPQGLVALLAVRGLGKARPRVVCTSHGGDWYVGRGRLMLALKRRILERLDAVAVVGEGMRGAMEAAGIPGRKISVISMGADLRARFTPDDTVVREPQTLFFAGRLVEKKGLSYLIDALSLIRMSKPAVRLFIAGWGPEEAGLQAQVGQAGLQEQVRFLGAVPHDQLVDWYRRASLAVFPFITAHSGDQEGLPLVMLEALGCACPLVTSEVPSVAGVVLDEVSGLVVPPRDSAALAAAIERLLEDPARAAALGTEGRRRVLERFDWGAVAGAYGRWLGAL